MDSIERATLTAMIGDRQQQIDNLRQQLAAANEWATREHQALLDEIQRYSDMAERWEAVAKDVRHPGEPPELEELGKYIESLKAERDQFKAEAEHQEEVGHCWAKRAIDAEAALAKNEGRVLEAHPGEAMAKELAGLKYVVGRFRRVTIERYADTDPWNPERHKKATKLTDELIAAWFNEAAAEAAKAKESDHE